MDAKYDPFNPAHYLDPHQRLSQLRAACPVSEPHPWSAVVVRDEDIRRALRDTQALSNAGDLVFSDNDSDPPTVFQLDPPEHTRLRRLQTHMTHTAIASDEPAIRQLAESLIDGFLERGQGDLMGLYANPFPLLVVMRLLGVSKERHEEFYHCAVEVKANLPYAFKRLPAWQRIKVLIQEMVDEHRSGQGQPNMLARLVSSEHHDHRLTDEDIRMAIFQLISGGSNATSLLIGNVIYRLLEHRELWERVGADRSFVAMAIEESLRYDSPAPWVMRLCRQETVIRKKPISAGKRVILSINSANRDETVWSEPEVFSLTRSQNKRTHLGFGYGPHFCLGAPLARMIGQVALDAVLTRLPGLQLTPGYRFEGVEAAMLHGPQRLDVQWNL